MSNRFGYIEDPGHSFNASYSPSSYDTFHDYTIDWQADYLSWFIDGIVVRTTLKNETLNGTDWPTTPSRAQLGLWSAGSKSLPKSTQDWAGGATDWASADYEANGGYYNVTIAWLAVECADVNQTTGVTGYTYGANTSTDAGPAVLYSTNNTKIYSLDATGVDLYVGQSDATNTTNGTIPGALSASSGARSGAPGANAWVAALAVAVGLGAAGVGAFW